MDSIKIISINVNGLRTREPELARFINQEGDNCIYAISDTRLSQDTNIRSIKDYTIVREDRVMSGPMATAGGVALLIPSKWRCQRVKLNLKKDSIEALAAIIFPSGENCLPIKIMSIYNHPGNHFPTELLNEFKGISLNGRDISGVIVGDFNCPNLAFGSRTTNEFGSKLLQNLNTENFVYFNDGEPTYYSSASGLPNVLDLVIGKPTAAPLIESCIVRGNVGSDHLPLITTLTFKVRRQTRSKVNRKQWASNVDKEMKNLELSDNIDENISKVNGIFREAYDNSCSYPRMKKQWLPPYIMQNIHLRKMLLRKRQNAQTDISRMLLTKRYNQINNRVKQQIAEFKEQQVEKLAESICNEKHTNKMWKLFKKFKSQCNDIEEPETPLLTPHGDFTYDDKSRSMEFARYLRSVHQTPNSPFFDNTFKREVDKTIGEQSLEVDSSSIPLIDVAQLDNLLMEVKAHSAPGEDLITYDILKLCSSNTRKLVCKLMNQCLSKNVFPQAWKAAKCVMLPKPGRDKYQASNYRPISLLSCLGKMLERHLYANLLKELNEKNFFNDHQAGFRKKRSTTEHLFRLAQQTSNGFKLRKCTLALFLDVRAAFDSVWKNGLKYKINKIGLSDQMRNMLFSFLDDRTLRVNVNGTWSEIVTLEAGTPQGSCLSPILYLIFVNDVTDSLDLQTLSASQFADDIGLWCTEDDVETATSRIQNAVKNLEKWCKKWFVSLHPAKSKLLLFTKCFRHKDEVKANGLSITLFNEQVSVVDEAVFLGVTFDSRLTYEPQTRKTLAKAYKRLNLLRMISAMTEKPKPEMLATLYKAIIRPIFEYGSICTVGAADVHLDKLQLLQNQALRTILKTPNYVAIKDLHDLSGLPPIKEHLILFARKQLESMKKHSPIVATTIDEYESVKRIKENASILDVL